ncbi:helix-turn-helix domain-containing protein [Paenibacillus apiarius]|uniref:XRE family transcriptional regulator n=1 Tax=Paenibacillus apiarius TaxID=46240 RepID=A0ABT4DZG0_9BACL|nr:XRE family transcriptional regulator [Paenibacillus apiarius]MBN3524964.1 helix-turn-helix transcriptional regulator [Paenibacillus apiarius]MCY9515155.1 XRE family transcriptional regulator [Paenibacillus apiarius]MCY9522744.1 XRE family transcriptional regulator [Paenibacillus apiarius]MCY9552964.1 XRE family transcriptional regulator [Paenibacillus apiarius]MCY9557619.1 XRE family transcriptional regulator [Paenibacillus apiarius]
MHEPIHKKIGKNLQDIRKSRNLSLDQVAEMSGVSKGMLGQIERGESNPTISVLWKIVNGLRISFATLMEESTPNVTVVHMEDTSPLVEEEGAYRAYPIFPFEQDKGFEVYSVVIEPGCSYTSEPHYDGVDEFIMGMEGELHVVIGGETYVLHPSMAMRFTANQSHTYTNVTDKPIRFITLIHYPSANK